MANPNNKSNLWAIMTVAIVCGLAAGLLGEIVAKYYILQDYSSVFSSEVNLSDLNSNSSGLVIRDPKKVVVNEDVKISETVGSIRPVLVGIFKEIASSSTPVAGQKADYYDLDNPLGVGLIMTADGWVMAFPSSDLKNDFKFKDYVAIGNDRQLYQIDKLSALKDLPGGAFIFHLAGASNLPVKKIIPRNELTLGESLLAVSSWNQVEPTTLVSISKTPSVLSSDLINARLAVAEGEEFKDAFVFDLAGNLAAVITDKEVIPAFSYNPSLATLTAGNKTGRPYLGVNYLDLSSTKSTAMTLNKGAWLYPASTSAAVIKDSPAQLAGLKAGDVITWVNNQELDSSNDLADLLSVFKPGDTVTLTYSRAGVEKSLEVRLGELK